MQESQLIRLEVVKGMYIVTFSLKGSMHVVQTRVVKDSLRVSGHAGSTVKGLVPQARVNLLSCSIQSQFSGCYITCSQLPTTNNSAVLTCKVFHFRCEEC